LNIWLIAAAAAALSGTPAPGAAGPAAAPATLSADQRFTALTTEEWRWREGELGRQRGEDEGERTDRLPRVDEAAQTARLTYWEGVLRSLAGIDPKTLTPENRINYEVYKAQIENLAAQQRFKTYEAPFNSDSSFWADLVPRPGLAWRQEADYRAYLGRLKDMPRYFDEEIANMRAGIRRGFTVPRASLVGRDQSIADVAAETDPQKNVFYAPFKTLPASMTPEAQASLRRAAEAAVRDAVTPAHEKLLRFIREEYVPRARTSLAAEALPDGAAFYRQMIREYATFDIDPDAVHAIGLKEVARIHAEMLEAMRATGFQGAFPAFLEHLRTDPGFYAKTPEELLARAALIAKRADGKLAQYFGLLPRGRFTIVPVPANIAPYYTSGRGGAHVYLLNTYDLPHRPLFQLTALTLHEAELGHGLQGELAEEQKEQPPFRRYTYISAYGEGWALYTEKLGKEMGLYETPYDDFGRLSWEMWRACRLVVDTGLHHLGWTRQQALDYLAENTALPLHEVETEVDRYITWPGQALSYTLGMLDIERLRAKAEAALGPAFDIRAFHDAVLATGSVPLPVLDERIDAFIADGGRDPAVSLKD
jgi:uncharacterized protein (DUF885 family)